MGNAGISRSPIRKSFMKSSLQQQTAQGHTEHGCGGKLTLQLMSWSGRDNNLGLYSNSPYEQIMGCHMALAYMSA